MSKEKREAIRNSAAMATERERRRRWRRCVLSWPFGHAYEWPDGVCVNCGICAPGGYD